MKSESVTSLSNSPRVAKLIQDIRAIVEVITINLKDFTDSQAGKTKAVKGKAAVSEKTEEPKAAVDTASKAKAVKGKAAATVEAAEEPKVASVEATAKTKKGKTVTIETPEEPKAVVETAVKPTKAAAKGKAAVTIETPEEPKVVVETAVKPTKAAKGKAVEKAKSPDVSSRTRSKKPKN